jgi:hypothetical protein
MVAFRDRYIDPPVLRPADNPLGREITNDEETVALLSEFDKLIDCRSVPIAAARFNAQSIRRGDQTGAGTRANGSAKVIRTAALNPGSGGGAAR